MNPKIIEGNYILNLLHLNNVTASSRYDKVKSIISIEANYLVGTLQTCLGFAIRFLSHRFIVMFLHYLCQTHNIHV